MVGGSNLILRNQSKNSRIHKDVQYLSNSNSSKPMQDQINRNPHIERSRTQQITETSRQEENIGCRTSKTAKPNHDVNRT